MDETTSAAAVRRVARPVPAVRAATGVAVPRVPKVTDRLAPSESAVPVLKGAAGPRPERPRREPPAPKPKPKRLVPGRTHRDALVAGLGDAERRIAEQLMSGGINAVRQSLDAQNKALQDEGKDAVDQAPMLTLADDLLPQIAAAEWRDFAEAAIGSANEIALRDLRSVVAKADSSTRDDATRLLAAQLREALDARVESMKENWVKELTAAINEGRLVRALKISGQPPEPGSKFPEELVDQVGRSRGRCAQRRHHARPLGAAWPKPSRHRRYAAPSRPSRRRKKSPTNCAPLVTKVASRVPAIATALGIDAPAPTGGKAPRKAGPPRQNVSKKPAPITRPVEAHGRTRRA